MKKDYKVPRYKPIYPRTAGVGKQVLMKTHTMAGKFEWHYDNSKFVGVSMCDSTNNKYFYFDGCKKSLRAMDSHWDRHKK